LALSTGGSFASAAVSSCGVHNHAFMGGDCPSGPNGAPQQPHPESRYLPLRTPAVPGSIDERRRQAAVLGSHTGPRRIAESRVFPTAMSKNQRIRRVSESSELQSSTAPFSFWPLDRKSLPEAWRRASHSGAGLAFFLTSSCGIAGSQVSQPGMRAFR